MNIYHTEAELDQFFQNLKNDETQDSSQSKSSWLFGIVGCLTVVGAVVIEAVDLRRKTGGLNGVRRSV